MGAVDEAPENVEIAEMAAIAAALTASMGPSAIFNDPRENCTRRRFRRGDNVVFWSIAGTKVDVTVDGQPWNVGF